MRRGIEGCVLLVLPLLLSALVVASGAPTCKLTVSGGPSGGLGAASFSCSGGDVSVALSPTVYAFNLSGSVYVRYDAACTSFDLCAITLCSGAQATFADSSIVGVSLPMHGVVCTSGGSQVEWRAAKFSGNSLVSGVLVGQGNDSIAVTDCTFADNAASGVYTNGSADVIATRSVFRNNTSPSGAGIHIQSGSVVASGCDFTGNHARKFVSAFGVGGARIFGGGVGGAIFALNPTLVQASGCSFTDNLADISGGGIHAKNRAQVLVKDSNFLRNAALDIGGGGIYTELSGSVTATRSNFSLNAARGSADQLLGAGGGAISTSNDASVLLTDCVVTNNTATWGGGVFMATFRLGSQFPLSLKVNGTRFEGNAGSGLLNEADKVQRSFVIAQDNCQLDYHLCLSPEFDMTCFEATPPGAKSSQPTSIHGEGRNICVSAYRVLWTSVVYGVFAFALLCCVVIAYFMARGIRKGLGNSRIGTLLAQVGALVQTRWGLIALTLGRTGFMLANIVSDGLVIGKLLHSGTQISVVWAAGYIAALLSSFVLAALVLHVRLVIHCGRHDMSANPTLVMYRLLDALRSKVAPLFAWVLGLAIYWPILAILDLPIIAMHALSGHLWFSWLRIFYYLQLHSVFAAAVESPFAAAAVTILYWKGMSPEIQFFLTDGIFVFTVGTSLAHIVVVFGGVCIATATGTLRQKTRATFKELAWAPEEKGVAAASKGRPMPAGVNALKDKGSVDSI